MGCQSRPGTVESLPGDGLRKHLTKIAVVLAAVLVASLAAIGFALTRDNADARIVIGKTKLAAGDDQKAPEATEPGLPEIDAPEIRPAPIVAMTASGGNGPPSEYNGSVSVPKDLKFFLVIGSDARPGQDVERCRADSIHIAAIDPQTREGTVIGLPRDSYVNIPGHGKRKINAALPLGGPDLLVRTVRELTGMPIEYYAITAFDGMIKITNTLKGVDINVPYDMDDPYSGARFKKGWRHMNGEQVLAFSRARHGVPGGDFGRSENQGRVIMHTLEKMRHEVKSEAGIRNWLKILYQYARLNMSMKDAFDLGKLARQLAPSDLKNKVAPGTAQNIDGQSVVVLSGAAYELFKDVRADAQADGNYKRGQPKAPPTTKPTAKPKPKPTPTPKPFVDLPI
jgi:polyisoprenyl-teichoic acid--peptidoglycan teichoic acid transferase